MALSTFAEIRDQYLDNVNYTTLAQVNLFIQAGSAILLRARRATSGQAAEEFEFDTASVAKELERARKWQARTSSYRAGIKIMGTGEIRDT